MGRTWSGHEAGSSDFNNDIQNAQAGRNAAAAKKPKKASIWQRWNDPEGAKRQDVAAGYKPRGKYKGKNRRQKGGQSGRGRNS